MTDHDKTVPTIIPGADGAPAFAVLPWSAYEELLEAAEDIADGRALDAIAADPLEEQLPVELVQRFLDGENPVRVWRDWRGLKAKELAALAGIAPNYLSQIEGGTRTGTLDVMGRIADALRIRLDDLRPLNTDQGPDDDPD